MAAKVNNKRQKDMQEGEPLIMGEEAVKLARHVTWVGFWYNAFLGLAKVVGGLFSKSSALVADGIHSFADFFSDIIVIMMVGVARKKPDKRYQFGHGRFEALATVILSLVLLLVAIGIIYEGIVNIINFCNGIEIPKPGVIALIIIIFSIVVKEWLYHYTLRVGKKIKSEVIVANAWHHRTDSFSSIATLIGVGGSMFFGEKCRILDPIAAIVVGIFIFIVGVQLAKPALGEMLGVSLGKEMKKALLKALKNTPGVLSYEDFKTFKSGNDGYVMVHIKVDPDITVREAHHIASNAEHNMRMAVNDLIIHPSTHIEPYKPRKSSLKKKISRLQGRYDKESGKEINQKSGIEGS